MEILLSCIQDIPDNGNWKKLVWSAEREKFNDATVDSVDRSLMVIIETMRRLGKLPKDIELKQASDGIYFRYVGHADDRSNVLSWREAEPILLPIFEA